ncbi:heterodisulfide reductase subunit C [Paenibacillus sp. W4I10]|uniref:hypothetical protein n=1 Tax=Paenibacillus sp. W4I10 TaxID=3042298 RepID=UPI002783E04B|nr:hypothetical protein [Paenibacillus sp. W4I10]MDQ0721919.1 heterodisulfide reductase subunit C [Paenibacillus sp. W4I10]
MRKRHSTEKAEWSETRENQYHKEWKDMVFEFGDRLIEVDGTVYLKRKEVEIKVIKPLKRKTFWYETWLRIKEIYNT